ncbi:MAG: tyrosine-protein phosphatase [Alteromonadaceae bacterium]|nr:tyrosine-protein phosphatase [Alteromonadaceae bacterium]
MKQLNIFMPLVAGLTTLSFNAIALDVRAELDRDSRLYTLSWHAEKPVSIVASGELNSSTSIVVGEQLGNTIKTIEWQAPKQDRYTFTFTEQDGEQAVTRSRLLNLEGGRNFRDLGGYETREGKTVKWGKLYRSGALHNLKAQDYALLEELAIQTVVDFRGNSERDNEQTQWQAGDINHMTWDYQLEFDGAAFKEMIMAGRVSEQDMEHAMASMYPGLLNQQKPHYKAMFAELASNDTPLLFHCTAGKDRTGVAAALILHALGVEKEVIMADYVLSEQILRPEDLMGKQDASKEQDPAMAMFARLPKPAIGALMGTRESYLNAAFDEMIAQSGSIDAFIREELGVSDAQIQQLKTNLLY